MSRIVLVALLVVVNVGGAVVAYYDLTLVSLVVMGLVALVLMAATLNRIKAVALEKEQLSSASDKYYLDEEQVRLSFIRFYSVLNDSLQFLRNVVTLENPLMSMLVLGSLYVMSLKAYYFGDFIFVLIFADLAIAAGYLMGEHRDFVREQSQKTKKQVATALKNLLNTIPRHVKQ